MILPMKQSVAFQQRSFVKLQNLILVFLKVSSSSLFSRLENAVSNEWRKDIHSTKE
jgi:hypothetical protein